MRPTRSASRRRSRQAALQVLYAVDLAERRPSGERLRRAEEAFQNASANLELPEGVRAFARELVIGTTTDLGLLDEVLARHATHWRVARMAAVDRNVLRLAAYEILRLGTPAPVAIDEAVELARRFGSERSPGFVNGILDAIAKEPNPLPHAAADRRELAK